MSSLDPSQTLVPLQTTVLLLPYPSSPFPGVLSLDLFLSTPTSGLRNLRSGSVYKRDLYFAIPSRWCLRRPSTSPRRSPSPGTGLLSLVPTCTRPFYFRRHHLLCDPCGLTTLNPLDYSSSTVVKVRHHRLVLCSPTDTDRGSRVSSYGLGPCTVRKDV